MSRGVFSKVIVNGFRFSSSRGVSTLSESPLMMLPALRIQLGRPLVGGGLLNGQCGCVGFARVSTNSVDSAATKVAAAQKEENDDKPNAGPVSGLDKKGLEPESGQVFKHGRHNMYVCWHPEVPFPYEMTKPIDLNAPVTDSHLKVQSLLPVKEAFRKKHHKLTVQELVKLTYSTKHRFYGQHGKQKRDVYREMDPKKEKRNRDYL